MKTQELFQRLDLFKNLTEKELAQVENICVEEQLQEGDFFSIEGESGKTLCIIKDGLMEVEITTGERMPSKVLLHLGVGQVLGEMSLVDRGTRSATARAIKIPTNILVIQHNNFHKLCESNYRIGYVVMQNVAADLSFKLRHRSLSMQGRYNDDL